MFEVEGETCLRIISYENKKNFKYNFRQLQVRCVYWLKISIIQNDKVILQVERLWYKSNIICQHLLFYLLSNKKTIL